MGDTDCWTFTYDHYCPSEQIYEGGDGSACKSYTGGNFLFSGDSEEIHTEGECIVPPTPLPTDPPTEGYTPSPTDAPTNAMTTAPPTDSPTKMTCGEKTVSDVCIAIDNSGSVCTSPGLSATLCDSCNNKCRAGGKLDGGLCCGNYGSITDFASSYVDRLPSESNFSV